MTPLSGDEQRALAVEQHMGLVKRIANRFRRAAGLLEFEDLVQEGVIGLLAAIDQFDPSRGSRFSDYAGQAIQRRITDAIARAQPIRLPAHVALLRRQVAKVAARLEALTGRKPTAAAIAQASRLEESAVEAVLSLPVVVASLDHPCGDDEQDTLGDLLPALETEQPATLERLWAQQLLAGLRPRERRVLERRLALDGGPEESLAAIAARLQMSREGVRMIEERALSKLRAALA